MDRVRDPFTAPELAGAAAIFGATLIMIGTALWLDPQPRARGCVKPTGVPATHFGECSARHSVQR